MHCFTYGSLMCEDIMSVVCGAALRFEPATLDGYRRQCVVGEHYPGMIPVRGHAVAGVLYFDLPDAAWSRLDRFEGDEYERQKVTVRLADGALEEAWTYVFRPEFAQRLTGEEWDFARFLQHGKERFIARYLGFGKLAGE